MAEALSVLWFRKDLRLDDNPALRAAIQSGRPVLPVFIWDPSLEESPGAASKCWLHEALRALSTLVEKTGSKLLFYEGYPSRVFQNLCQESKIHSVFWNRSYEPALIARDTELKKELKAKGIEVHSFPGNLLVEPWEILNKQGKPYQVFTPYWNAVRSHWEKAERPEGTRKIPAPSQFPRSISIDELKLLPTLDWGARMMAHWEVAKIPRFKGLENYSQNRDIPGVQGTSRYSPYLAWGQTSPRLLAWDLRVLKEQKPALKAEILAFTRQLAWREFAHHLLYHFPFTPSKPLRKEFERFPWKRNRTWEQAWSHGQTGYPIVDAGMRELWATGWMHNRVRMIVASFLVKHLNIPWQVGARWFWDTLVDADLANNTLGWQWVAGCGADAAPYFRVFNPVLQGEKFDPKGEYVKKWVPELKELGPKQIHRPWEANMAKNYPKPIVEHGPAREKALAAYQSLRKK